MKILAFVDLHGDREALAQLKKKANSADVLVSAGDITIFESGLDEMIKELDKIGKPVIMIHGNHEFDETMEHACKKTKNVRFIHKTHHKMDDLLFLGYGGGGFSFEYKNFHKVGKKFKKLAEGHKVVFIIHGPPYNTTVDEVVDDHVGNLTMREFIDEAQPEVVICGHIHENSGKHDIVGSSYVLNPGPEGRIIDL